MQVFGNVATELVRKESKASGKGYFEFRLAESHRGLEREPATFYTCRVMKDSDPHLAKGDFVKVTGRLKADYYLSREGKPTGTLLIIAFEAAKIAKPAATSTATTGAASPAALQAVVAAAPEPPSSQPTAKPVTAASVAFDWED